MESGVGSTFSAHYASQHGTFISEHGKNQEFLFEDVYVEITDDDDDQDSKKKNLQQEYKAFFSIFRDLTFFKEDKARPDFYSQKAFPPKSPLYLYYQVFRI
jgi:hypothetical protein